MKAQDLKFLTVAAVVALGLGLAGCSSSSDSGTAATPPPDPGPTAYETALDAINGAETEEAAQAAYDAVDQAAISGDESAKLQMALADKLADLAMMAREDEQKQALMDAAGMIDTSDLSTQELVDAAEAGIRALRQALEDADDVSDADKAMYMSTLDDAVAAVDGAQDGIDTATRRTNQMAALSGASDTLQAALTALFGSTPTQAQLDAANNARTALMTAITDAADLTDAEKAPYQREANNAAAPIQTAQTAFENAEDEATKTANAAMAALAAKLYAGIGSAPLVASGDGVRAAVYSGTSDAEITVTRDPDLTEAGSTDVTEALKATDMTVADLHGWKGKQYTASGTGVVGTYEAHVYSREGAATQGDKFGKPGETTAPDGYEYGLDADGELATLVAAQIESPSFDQGAGVKEFELGTNLERVVISGMYHGVSGTYYCDPANDGTCSSTVAAEGFTLGGGTWTFKPTNPEARVTSVADTMYASYGWWLHTAEDGTLTASAFEDYKGGDDTAELASAVDTLQGTATYSGGAAGKYALSSALPGGVNDAGHFTAKATLSANFITDKITGTIDQFVDGDGESKDWSVALQEQGVGATGAILGDDGTGTAKMTVWTIGGTAAAAAGQWSGQLYENHETSGVPQVATGTFFSTYGTAGRLVGGFGASEQ